MSEVLYVSNFLASGSNRSYCEDLSDRLEHRGWRVTRTSRVQARTARLFDMMRTAWKRHAAYDVAVIDVYSGPAFLWAEAVAFELRRLHKPYVLTLHGGSLPDFAQRWPRRVRRLLRSAALVTAPSEFMRERMRETRSDIALVRNAVDTSAFTFALRSRPRPQLVWVRAFHAIYNPVLAIEVLARVPGATLTMLGPDKGDGSLAAVRARAAALGVEDRLEIVGRVPRTEVARYLARADVFVNTTDVDNTPLSVLEAMATGLCVVTTNAGGLPYLVEHETSGLLARQGDAAAMSAAIRRLLAEPALAEQLSRGARARALEHDWSPVLDQWAHLLEKVIAHA